MMQQALFEPAPAWPDGWDHGTLVDEKSAPILNQRRRLVMYTHAFGAKVTTSQKWNLSTGEFVCTRFRVWLTEDVWCRHWIHVWSSIGTVRPGKSEDWDRLLESTEPAYPNEECPDVYGQWVFIRALLEALRSRGDL